MGLNILFWNCQGIRPKRKELELYVKENDFDIVAPNETFLNKKHNFKIPGYHTIRNDRSTGIRGGVTFLIIHGLVVNKEYRNEDFNIITENESLAINLDLSDNQNITLATIYCPNGNHNLSLFQTINNLSENVMFVGDFKSKLEFQIGDDLGSDHLPIEMSIDTPPHGNTFTNHTKYKFGQTDREVFESTLDEALGSTDLSGLLSTSDLDKYADFIVTAISPAFDRAIPKSKSVRPESNPISDETLALIKEKRRLRRQYSQKKDPAIKTRTNQLQKQVQEELKVESLVSWEKFYTSISLETDPTVSWRKIKNFLKPKVSAIIQLCTTRTKSPRLTLIKRNSFRIC